MTDFQGIFGSKRKAKNSNLRETAIACQDGYGWLPVWKEHLIAVDNSIREMKIQKVLSKNVENKLTIVRHQENFKLPSRDGELWWRCGEKKSSPTRQCGPGSISRFCVICGMSFI